MTISDWVVIAAMIVAPILAVQVQKVIERKRGQKARKMKLFKTLMANRANPLSALHVEALNMIDIEFYNDINITDAWKLLLDQYANYPQDINDPQFQTKIDMCSEKASELLTDLLFEMASSLGYSFDKVHLKRGAYIPKGHADVIMDQEFFRNRLKGVLLGEIPIPIKIVEQEENEE